MSWTQGLVECYPLGPNCFVDWGAVTTALAVIVALGVGIAPIIRDRRHRERHARMAAKILAGELSLLEHRLRVAAEIALQSNDIVDHWQHKQVKLLLLQVTSQGAIGLVQHIRDLPPNIESTLAECIGLLSAYERNVSKEEETLPYETVKIDESRKYCVALADKLSDFRAQLCKWSGATNEDPIPAVAEGVKQALVRASDNRIRFQEHNPPSSVSTMQPS